MLAEVQNAGSFGIEIDKPRVDFDAISQRRNRIIEHLGAGVAGLLKKNRVEVVKGSGVLSVEGHTIVDDRIFRGTVATVLATGSVRRRLPGIDFGARVIGTEEGWAFNALPASLAVIGAGSSGAEIASAYARLGTKVLLYEDVDRVLPAEDDEVSQIAKREFEAQGIEVRTSARIQGIAIDEDRVTLECLDRRDTAEWIVVAVGRAPDTSALGLSKAGVKISDSGHVLVDDHLRTSVPKIYAIGDLVAGPALAHKASEEGIIAVETAAGNRVEGMNHEFIPRVTFCSPNVGSFGLSEEAARAQGHDVVVGRARYDSVGAGLVTGAQGGLFKIVGERRYGSILGAHIVGTRATELIQQVANVSCLEGGIPELARIVHGHPTLSEGMLEAARRR